MRQHRQRPLASFIPTAAIVAVLSFATFYTGIATGHDHDPVPQEPTMTVEERAERFRPGAQWSGRGPHGISEEEAVSFADYPIFWLGESFAGYNLYAIIPTKWAPESPRLAYEAMDEVGFGYGQCVIPEQASACPVPILIKTEPVCLTRPETVANVVKVSSTLETVRGEAQLMRFTDGHVRIWTGEVSVYIDAVADPTLVDQIVEALQGVNHAARAGESLLPPDFSGCPPVDPNLIQ